MDMEGFHNYIHPESVSKNWCLIGLIDGYATYYLSQKIKQLYLVPSF